MSIHNRQIRMQDTDATGAIYFTSQLRIALEAFEELLEQEAFSLHISLHKNQMHFPIVHAESDYLTPMRLGDKITIHLHVSHIGTSSFKVATQFFKQDVLAGKVEITHVVISSINHKSIPIPEEILTILNKFTKE